MNQNNISLENAIKGLECCLGDTRADLPNLCTICPYAHGSYATQTCGKKLREDALALLKQQAQDLTDIHADLQESIADNLRLQELVNAQEPRMMTLGDLRDIGSVWELNTPPYLWMDINPSYKWTRGFWVAWREIFNMIDGLHPTYDADNYGKIWRCWTTKPSLKQMEETPWL